MEKFKQLGLSKGLVSILEKIGFKQPSEIQEKAIPLALAGKDIVGGSATGSGKTFAFASPIIENLKPSEHIQALILTPTRELADQVADSIKKFSAYKSLNVLAVYGGIRIESQIRKLSNTDILVGTPGRILDHINRRTLNFQKVKFLVLDEVDRMFDMGFRKDVEMIIQECPKDRQTMMFSATISPEIDYLSKKYTRSPKEISVKSRVDPRKLQQCYYDVPTNRKFSLLVSLLRKENSKLVIVFSNTRRNVDVLTKNLLRNGINASAIHGGLEQKKRTRILGDFHNNKTNVLVCTDVVARGLDIKGVTHVYNYDLPTDAKDYIHRIGRTARAGKEGKAITLLSSRDYENFRNLTYRLELEIKLEELPQLERIEWVLPRRTDSRGNNFRGSRSRDSPRRGNSSHRDGSRGDFHKRSDRSDSRGNRSRDSSRGNSHRRNDRSESRGNSHRSHDSRRDSSRGRSNSRSSGRFSNNRRNSRTSSKHSHKRNFRK